jgi:hypothetical protein
MNFDGEFNSSGGVQAIGSNFNSNGGDINIGKSIRYINLILP